MTTDSIISHYTAPEIDSDQDSFDQIVTEHQWSQLPGTSVFELQLTYLAEEDIDTVPYAIEALRNEIRYATKLPQLTLEDATALYYQQYSAYLDNDARAKRHTKMHADTNRLNAPADTNKLNAKKKRRQERKKKKKLAHKTPRLAFRLSAHQLNFAKAKFQQLLSFTGLTDLAEFIQACETYDKFARLIEMKLRTTEASVEEVASNLAGDVLEGAKALKEHASKQGINPTDLPILPEAIKSQSQFEQIRAWIEEMEEDTASYKAVNYYLNTRTPRMRLNEVLNYISSQHAVLSLIKQMLQIEKQVNHMNQLVESRKKALATLQQKFYPYLFKAPSLSDAEDFGNIWAERPNTPLQLPQQ